MGKEQAVIFDVDGTLAGMSGRISRHGKRAAPYLDQDAHDDEVVEELKKMVDLLKGEYTIIICSGRKDSSYYVLEKWLQDNKISFDKIFMRKDGDNRKDSEIKKEIYLNDIEPLYDIFVVFDDRNQVVEMWRSIGLKCFQVAEGNF